MKQELYTGEGKPITKEEIKKAVDEGRAVLRWSHGNWENRATLLIFDDAETADMEAERDTRGKCYSMADEIWSELATYSRAIRAAAGLLRTS